jgi:nitric oxide reductase subunit B
MGLGYLDTQLKIQIHFVMLIITASVFATGVGLFIYDFFRFPPRFTVGEETPRERELREAAASGG